VNSTKVIKRDKVEGVFCLLRRSLFPNFEEILGQSPLTSQPWAAGIPSWQQLENGRGLMRAASIASIEDALCALRSLLHNTSNLSPLCSLRREKLFALAVPTVLSGLGRNNTLAQSCRLFVRSPAHTQCLSMGAKLIPTARHQQRNNSVIIHIRPLSAQTGA
jgi:hypothetical protein